MPDELRFELDRSAFRFEELLRENSNPSGPNFGKALASAIENLGRIDEEPDKALAGVLSGEEQDLHSVMLRLNEADLSLRFALEVRNKILDAFQELQRMPV